MLDNIKNTREEPLHLNSKVLLIDSMNTFLRSFAMINHMNPSGAHIGGLTGFLKSIGFALQHQVLQTHHQVSKQDLQQVKLPSIDQKRQA